MTRDEIKDIYNKSAAELREDRSLPAFRKLSLAIGELRDAGLDIEVDAMPWPNNLAFAMSEAGYPSVPLSGIIRAGGMHYMFGIATAEQSNPCLKLYISKHDIRFHNAKESVYASIYDLEGDDTAFQEVQEKLIASMARAAVLREADPGMMIADHQRLSKRKLPGSSSGLAS